MSEIDQIITDKPLTIFLSVGEASGDAHAAHLIRSLRKYAPNAKFVGLVGSQMVEAGCESVADITSKATMLGGPLLKLGYYIRKVRNVCRKIAEIKPDIFVPIDSPALNWHLADAARNAGSVVAYFVCPQVWAWATWRVKKLARLAHHVACILPFEEKYLRDRGIDATYVGHPLFDYLPEPTPKTPDIIEAWGKKTLRVALVPGSRKSEIKNHARAFYQAALAIRRVLPKSTFAYTARTEKNAEQIRAACPELAEDKGIEIAAGRTNEVLDQAHLAIVASGTVTLQVAHFGTPMVVAYKVGWLLRFFRKLLGRIVVSTKYFSLVNILAGRKLVPELMPWNGNMNRLCRTVLDVAEDMGWLARVSFELTAMSQSLKVAPPDSACDRAARVILQTYLKNRPQ